MQIYEHHMKYCPSTVPDGSGWDKPTTTNTYDDATDLHAAWGLMIHAAEGCNASSSSFIFDLVDVGREFLSLQPCLAALQRLSTVKTLPELAAANASMHTLLTDLDLLLATSDGFLLGTWLSSARALAATADHPEHSDFLEWNARAQVTSWEPVSGAGCRGGATKLSGLYDYANKEWSGLVNRFHRERYRIYADHRRTALASGHKFDKSAYQGDLMEQACQFQRSGLGDVGPVRPVGDAIAISKMLWQKYHPKNNDSLQ